MKRFLAVAAERFVYEVAVIIGYGRHWKLARRHVRRVAGRKGAVTRRQNKLNEDVGKALDAYAAKSGVSGAASREAVGGKRSPVEEPAPQLDAQRETFDDFEEDAIRSAGYQG